MRRKSDLRTWKDYFPPLSKKNAQKRVLSREEKLAQIEGMRGQFYGWKK